MTLNNLSPVVIAFDSAFANLAPTFLRDGLRRHGHVKSVAQSDD
jgi:hypothetical protein